MVRREQVPRFPGVIKGLEESDYQLQATEINGQFDDCTNDVLKELHVQEED